MAAGGPNEDQSRFVIGLRDIYEQLQLLSAGQHLLVNKLDSHIMGSDLQMKRLTEEQAEQSAHYGKLEERVRAMEQRPIVTPRSMWTAISIIASIIGLIMSIFFNFWSGK